MGRGQGESRGIGGMKRFGRQQVASDWGSGDNGPEKLPEIHYTPRGIGE